MTGEVDRKFLERFGASAVLSVLGASLGGNARGGEWGVWLTPREMYRHEMGLSIQRQAETLLRSQANIQPTVHVHQGSRVNVFLARDLDFTTTRPAP